MKKVLLLVVAIMTLSLVLTSCGDGKKKTEDTKEVAKEVKKEAKETPKADTDYKGDPAKGKVIYDGNCMACHMTGVTGAPKMDEKERWATIYAQGIEVLHEHAIKGFQGKIGLMPPKGGFAKLSDNDVKDAIAFMLKESGATK